MFSLFQKRDFSTQISDTFNFLKLEGKNYFKHFLKICGIPLFLILILIYVIADLGVSSAVSANAYGGSPDRVIEQLFTEHWGTALLMLLGLMIIGLVMGIICYSYPIFYMQNLASANQEVDQSKIGKQIMGKLGQIIVFFLGTTFIFFPLIMIMAYVSMLLAFLLIGIPILILMIPTVYSVLTLAFFEYLTRNVGFFTAYGNAIRYVRYNYWSIIGNTFIFYLITTMITFIPSFIIQMLVLGGGMLFDPQNIDDPATIALVTWGIVLLYFVYILLGTLSQNIMFINQGIIFYSEREKEENFFTKRKIDSIGSNNE
ncbi:MULTISPECIES: hypothetical protein [unclassified Myroides]|uniref:hypothetical protein n=1 Tax=unclassified Myroides TaxID=2642485 RepID=UPI003D2F521E